MVFIALHDLNLLCEVYKIQARIEHCSMGMRQIIVDGIV